MLIILLKYCIKILFLRVFFTAVQCPPGQVYQVCGSACNATCSNIANDPNCESTCVEGCACPPGLTLNDKDQCVPVNECPCTFDGNDVAAGQQLLKGNELW